MKAAHHLAKVLQYATKDVMHDWGVLLTRKHGSTLSGWAVPLRAWNADHYIWRQSMRSAVSSALGCGK